MLTYLCNKADMHYSRLKLTVQAPLKLKDITYKFVVKNKITKKTTNFEGRFDENGLTIWYEINNLNTSLAYIIYLKGTVLQTISAQAYPNKKTQSVYKLTLYTTNFTEPLSYQDSAFLKLPKFP